MASFSYLIHSVKPSFEQFQIVCLEHGSTKLYAEVVQTVEATRICWVRPLLLIQAHPHSCDFSQHEILEDKNERIHDLREGSDLLLPAALFRNALDTEVIPLLSSLNTLNEFNNYSTNHGKLNQFIQQVCQSHPEVFQNSSTS